MDLLYEPPKTTNGMSIVGDSNINCKYFVSQCNHWKRRISKNKTNSGNKKMNLNQKKENDNRKTKTKKARINGATIASSQANYALILKSSVSRSLMKRYLICTIQMI